MNTEQGKVMWRADTDEWRAIQVVCPDGLYPHSDIDGKKIYENTHFETPEQAWRCLSDECNAWLQLTINRLNNLEKRIETTRAEVVEASKAVVVVRKRMGRD